MLKEKWSTGLRKGLIISLSVLLILPYALFFGGKKVDAQTWTGSSTHYNIAVTQVSAGKNVIISWAPTTTANSRYVDRVTLTLGTNTNQNISLWIYGEDQIVFTPSSTTDPTSLETVTTNSSVNIGSDVYFLNQYLSSINTHVNSIDINVEDIITYIDAVETYLANIATSLYQMNNNGISLRNYDITLYQIPIISYFVGNLASIQNTNDFLYGNTLIFDYPIYKGFTSTNGAYLTTDTTDDIYIMIVAVNSSYQIFANVTYTAVSGWSDVSTVDSGYKRYSNQLQFNYLILKNNKNGSDYTGSRFYINYINNALTHLNNEQYIPIYYGKVSDCPMEYLSYVGLSTTEENQVNDVSSDMDDINDELNQTVDNIDQVEVDLTSDFEDNIQAIDTTFDITDVGDGLYYSAQWLRTQFNNLTTSTPYGTLILFSMTVGLALLLIGRKL